MSDDKKSPPVPELPPEVADSDAVDFRPLRLKKPGEPFPEHQPIPVCVNNCKKFYENHSGTLSFAFYSVPNSKSVCAFFYSCGIEIESYKFELQTGDNTESFLRRALPDMFKRLIEFAMVEKEAMRPEIH